MSVERYAARSAADLNFSRTSRHSVKPGWSCPAECQQSEREEAMKKSIVIASVAAALVTLVPLSAYACPTCGNQYPQPAYYPNPGPFPPGPWSPQPQRPYRAPIEVEIEESVMVNVDVFGWRWSFDSWSFVWVKVGTRPEYRPQRRWVTANWSEPNSCYGYTDRYGSWQRVRAEFRTRSLARI